MAPSPAAHTPDSDMATAASGEWLPIILQLMAEKDRLIAEKDELVVSKDRLWREMYQIVQEKSDRVETTDGQRTVARHAERDQWEIQQLRDENVKLHQRIQDLEAALRDAFDTDEDCEDEPGYDVRSPPAESSDK